MRHVVMFAKVMLILAAAAVALPLIPTKVLAQDWTLRTDIFVQPPDQRDDQAVWSPKVLADSEGGVHVFWTYSLPGSSNRGGDFIMYSTNQGGFWTIPNEIIGSPVGGGPIAYDVVLDSQGYFHIVWYDRRAGFDARLYYSKSHIDNAGSVHGWSIPYELAYYEGDALINPVMLLVDKLDQLHVITVEGDKRPENFVYLQSKDGGESWNNISNFKGSLIDGSTFWQPRGVIDDRGVIHVSWISERQPGEGYDGFHTVLYAQSNEDGRSWSDPQILEDSDVVGLNDVALAIDGQNILHAIWNSSGNSASRFHKRSNDLGITWQPTEVIYSGSGRTFPPALAIDGSGNLHLVSSGNAFDYITGLFYWKWDGQKWVNFNHLSQQYGYIGENPASAISLGSTLHLVWRNDSYSAISYMSRPLDAKMIDAIPIPAPLPDLPNNPQTVTSEAVVEESNLGLENVDESLNAETQVLAVNQYSEVDESTQISSPSLTLLFAAVASVIFVAAIFFFVSRPKSGRS